MKLDPPVNIPLITNKHLTSGELQTERAIADFRNGYPIAIIEGEERFIVQSIDNLEEDHIRVLQNFAGDSAHLVLSSARLRKLRFNSHDDMARVALPEINRTIIENYALSQDAQVNFTLKAPIWIDRVALELARLSLVLPAVIVIPVGQKLLDSDIVSVSAENIRKYRKLQARHIYPVSRAAVPLEEALDSEFIVFRGGEGLRDQVAIIVGQPDYSKPVDVRLHSACLTGDLFGSLKCDCGDQLRSTIRYMTQNQGGILLYLDQEGRGNGLANKIRAYNLQALGYDTYDADEIIGFDQDQRLFDFAAEMLKQIGVKQVRLMTNNPLKISALQQAGITVVSDRRIEGRKTEQNTHYLKTKRDKAGHMLDLGDTIPGDTLPEGEGA